MLANWIKVEAMGIEKKLTVFNCHADKIPSSTPVQWFLTFYVIFTLCVYIYACMYIYTFCVMYHYSTYICIYAFIKVFFFLKNKVENEEKRKNVLYRILK